MQKAEVYKLIEDHFRDNNKKIVHRITRYIHDKHNAEDVVQEAYYRCCKYWTSYDAEQTFSTWFGTILNNSIKSFMGKEIVHGMATDMPPEELMPLRMMQRLEVNEVLELIANEEPRVRRILNLFLVYGYTSQEIDKVVPESASNIRKIVQRFRDKLSNRG